MEKLVFALLNLLIAILLFSFATSADQWSYMDKDVAKGISKQIKPGSFMVEWISHIDQDAPTLYLIHDHWVEMVPMKTDKSDFHAEIKVVAEPIAVVRKHGKTWNWMVVPKAKPVLLDLDLAYTYLPETSNAARFFNASSSMKLEAKIKNENVNLPQEISKEAVRRSHFYLSSLQKTKTAGRRSF